VGPHRALVGRKVADLPAGQASPVSAIVATKGLDAVDPDSGQVPAMIFGRLSGAVAPQASWVVVSVNGTIAGSALVAKGRSPDWHFLGMVDEAYFTKGRNDVRLHVVDNGGLRALQAAA